ncbi:MAG TPA: 4-(cytidine 5'-diphospho)-2-C-methyl-D-erythritol kinase [Sphingomicrobium sp.]|nr:4-(cytidine 5'-diphospho)-2-C-methyl-D-erythritol kinase [Sphingomicrobium sp.]
MSAGADTAYAKLNLALHVRARRADGRHDIETIFAFCEDGDRLSAEPADTLSLTLSGPFADALSSRDNLVLDAARALQQSAGVDSGARLHLDKQLPVASGIGGGSADAAAALRLLTRLWSIDEEYARAVAPSVGSDVPACLLSRPCRGSGAGDELEEISLPGLARRPVLLVNPRVPLSTTEVFARWSGVDYGPLEDWRTGRNDLEAPARRLVPQIALVLSWLETQPGADFVRMSGSGATCFALFQDDQFRNRAAAAVPREWWHLATRLR